MSIDSNDVAIVVPVHKSDLSITETISLRQCVSVLGKYDITIAHPQHVSVKEICDSFDIANSVSFNDECFSSYSNYNRTIRSDYFYGRFTDYNYILLHELDAFVFYDDLSSWCNTGFDYIGAPLYPIPQDAIAYCLNGYWPFWAKFNWAWRIMRRDLGILVNGGLSLRRTRTMYSIAQKYKKKVQLWGRNDDLFWSAAAAAYSPRLKIPAEDVCARFALMTEARDWVDKMQGNLPFGCHGWPRYEVDFWRPHIESFGYRY